MADTLAGFGFAAALTAPLACVLGFTIWGDLWTGHPYMLNCFKGCVATLLCIATVVSAQLAGWNSALDQVTAPVAAWLLLSSFLGIVVGDTCWLQAQQLLDTRSVVLIDALKPGLSAFWGFMFLGEAPTWGWCGAVLSWGAVTWVACEPAAKEESQVTAMTSPLAANDGCGPAPRSLVGVLVLHDSADSSGKEAAKPRRPLLSMRGTGYVYAFLNVLFDSAGSLIIRLHGGALQPWDIASVRFGGASIVMLLSVGAASLFSRMRPGLICRAVGTPGVVDSHEDSSLSDSLTLQSFPQKSHHVMNPPAGQSKASAAELSDEPSSPPPPVSMNIAARESTA